MRILLTGATGFVGSHLLPRLIEAGHSVATDLNTLNHDVVIHLAAKTHTSLEFDPGIFESNILLTSRIFKTNARVIFASSCSTMHLTNPYAYSKSYGEYLASNHRDAVSLRFFNIYGSGNNKGIVKYLLEKNDGDNIIVRGPSLVRDYIHVSDVVDFILFVLHNEVVDEKRSPEKIIEVGSGKGTRTISLVNLIMELTGKRFYIDYCKPYASDPFSMVASKPIPCMDLKTGLLKTIEDEDINSRSII